VEEARSEPNGKRDQAIAKCAPPAELAMTPPPVGERSECCGGAKDNTRGELFAERRRCDLRESKAAHETKTHNESEPKTIGNAEVTVTRLGGDGFRVDTGDLFKAILCRVLLDLLTRSIAKTKWRPGHSL
jgi:hypothetical protein